MKLHEDIYCRELNASTTWSHTASIAAATDTSSIPHYDVGNSVGFDVIGMLRAGTAVDGALVAPCAE